MEMKTQCRVLRDASHAHRSTENALGALRRLRRGMTRCMSCPEMGQCQYRADFNAVIDTLIAEINEEWSEMLGR